MIRYYWSNNNSYKAIVVGFIKSKRCDNSGVAPRRGKDGITYRDDLKKADIPNEQFTSVFNVETSDDTPGLENSTAPTMPDINVTCNGVNKLLNNIKVHKATGPDDIPARLLKECAPAITPVLTLIFQISFKQGRIPKDWKHANVTPLFKKGDRANPANYRPVSLTSICCKTLEHIIHSQIMQHLEKNGLLTDFQHGFRKRRSCETQLLQAIDDLARALNDNQQYDLILLDFSKAFDKVPHKRLLTKMSHNGVRGRTLDWIGSFLGDRTQSVVLNNQRSSESKVTSGVPQGTVLGPLLFLVYINDLPDVITPGTTARLFADDCALYRKIENEEDQAILQNDLDKLVEWEQKWLMEFHPTKCQLVHITHRKKPFASTYSIHNIELTTCDSAKYLGVSIQSKLSWNGHINSTAKKSDGTQAFIQRNLSACPPKVKAQCYTTLVRPILEYASIVWDPHTATNIYKLERVQRRSARTVFNNWDRETSVTTLLEKLKWETLKLRRENAKMTMMYRIHSKSVDLNIPSYIHKSTTTTRRQQNRYIVPFGRIDTFKCSYFPSSVRLWNTLSQHHIDVPTVDEFKAALDRPH